MNEECKYCSYLKQCPDIVEYNSIYCKCHKRIPKNRNMSYEQLQNNWNELKKWLEECLNEIKQNDVYDRTSYENGEIIAIESVSAKMQELEGNND